MAKPPIEELDPRDGPTDKFKAHHDTTDRKEGGGKRIYRKLEQLLRTDYIQPEQCEAGGRFSVDYLKGEVGRGRSCLDIATRGNGDGHPSADRIEAATRFREAIEALDESQCHAPPGWTPADMLIACCVEELAFSTIAQRANVSDDAIKSWISQALAVLVGHYNRIDKAAGRSSTQYTKEAALKRFDPSLD